MTRSHRRETQGWEACLAQGSANKDGDSKCFLSAHSTPKTDLKALHALSRLILITTGGGC